MKETINKLDSIKIKNFCPVKDNVKRMTRQTTDGEKTYTKDIFDKGPVSQIYKELLKVHGKNTHNPFKNGPKTLETLK